MKQVKKGNHPWIFAAIAAVATFVICSVFAGGLIEVSREIGFFRWIQEILLYALLNKFAYKLIASLSIGLVAYFVSSMIAYGKAVKAKRHSRTLQVQFTSADSSVGKTA